MALSKAGLHPGRDVTIDYRKTHESCLLQVQNGEAEACSTAHMALNMVSNKLSQGLRPVGLTEKIPGILFMVHKRVPAKIRKQLQSEIISWNNSDKGRKILRSIHFGEFKLVDNSDYNHFPKPN